MKKLRKLLSIAISAIVIIAVIAILAAGLFANYALDVAIESAGTRALNVGVRVSDVDLSILRGNVGIRKLAINNPPGYQHDKLLDLADGRVAVSVKSLLGEVINIKDIKLDGMDIVLEQRGVSSNNLQDIINNMPPGKRQASEPGGRKLQIDKLEITNAKVRVKLLPVPGRVDTLTFKLAPIRMTDLGSKDDIDTAALSRRVLLAIAAGIAEQGAGLLPNEMLSSLVSELGRFGAVPNILLKTGTDLLKAGAGMGKGAKDAGENVGKGVIKGVEDIQKGIGEGLKGILKKKEEGSEN